MGWISLRATYYKNGKIDRKAEIEEQFNKHDFEIVKSVVIGSTVYSAVMEKESNGIFAVVSLTRTQSDIFYYKIMDETEGPYYYDCPESILKLLTPTDNEEAMNWRIICWNKQEQKKAKKNDPNSLNNLPIGTVIQFTIYEQTVELIKHSAAYQFKRPFWMDEKYHCYWSVKHIPENYKVITY